MTLHVKMVFNKHHNTTRSQHVLNVTTMSFKTHNISALKVVDDMATQYNVNMSDTMRDGRLQIVYCLWGFSINSIFEVSPKKKNLEDSNLGNAEPKQTLSLD